MNKKLYFVPVILIVVMLMITSCSGRSDYDSLSESDKSIVDTVLENQYRFSNCNGIRFDSYNGKTYFVASYTEYGQTRDTGKFGGAVGAVKSTKFFTVENGSLVEQPYDVYSSKTQYGAVSKWDNNWSTDDKKDALAKALK